jgi:hypothetical protein
MQEHLYTSWLFCIYDAKEPYAAMIPIRTALQYGEIYCAAPSLKGIGAGLELIFPLNKSCGTHKTYAFCPAIHIKYLNVRIRLLST